MGQSVSTRKPCRPSPYFLKARDSLLPVDQGDLKLKGATLPLQQTLVQTLTSATVATVDPNNTARSTFAEVEVEVEVLTPGDVPPGDVPPPAYKPSTHHHHHHHHTEDGGYGSIDRDLRSTTVSILKKGRVVPSSNEGGATEDRDDGGPRPENVRRVRFHNKVQRFEYPPGVAATREAGATRSSRSVHSVRMSAPFFTMRL